jgi:hypothetical protein
VYVPAEPEQERSELLEVPNVTLVGASEQTKPVEGDTDDARAIVPVKLCRGVTVMEDVPEAPAKTVTDVGLAETAKS